MQNLSRSRRGMTLAEIMVALGLVSVMIVMAVSFTMLITRRTRTNAENDALRADCTVLEAGVEAFVNSLVAENAEFSVDGEVEVKVTVGEGDDAVETEEIYYDTLKAKVGDDEYTLSFSYSSLNGTVPDGDGEGKSITFRTEKVSDVTFRLMKNDANGDFLLFCYVADKDSDKKSEGDIRYVFCVNPRVGETMGG